MEKLGFIALARAYLKRHGKTFFLLAIFSLVFAAVFYLYSLPVEAVLYACAICFSLGIVFVLVDLRRYRQRHAQLVALKRQIALSVEELPVPRDLLEEDTQALVRELFASLREAESSADREREETLSYYTLWAHQVKTPIAAMRLLLEGREERALENELFKMEQYVDMVLQYARLGANASDLVLRKCELEPIVRKAVRKYARLFIGKRISLELGELPARVLTDDKWLGFAVEQLISNAVKYTPEGGRILIAQEGESTLIVEDTGIGIRPEDLPRVFEKGFTGYNGRGGEKSTGIGLYLSKRILTRLSHTIRLESAPGAGTRAIINLETIPIAHE